MSKRYMIKIGAGVLLIVLVLLCYSFFAWRKEGEEQFSVQETEKKETFIIGATLASDATDYQEELGNLMKEISKEDSKYTLDLQYAQWDVENQLSQMRDFIQRKVDAIILCPVNAKSFLNVLKEADKAGIPVINLNMKVDTVSSEYIATYVGASMSEEAALAAEIVIDYFDGEGGKVGIIEGAPGSDPQIYRSQTFIEQLTPYPEIEVVGIADGKWDRNHASLAAMDLIKKNPGLDLIYCHDSNMALGAYETLVSMEKEEEIKVIGIGNATEYMDAVREGKLYGIVSQPSEYEANYALICAKKAADGSRLRPWYKNPVEILTKENVDKYRSPMEGGKGLLGS